MNVVHQAGLKNILQELVVDNRSSGLDLQDNRAIHAQAVRVERLVNVIIESEKNGYWDLESLGLTGFYTISDLFKKRSEVRENTVAVQIMLRGANLFVSDLKALDKLKERGSEPD